MGQAQGISDTGSVGTAMESWVEARPGGRGYSFREDRLQQGQGTDSRKKRKVDTRGREEPQVWEGSEGSSGQS